MAVRREHAELMRQLAQEGKQISRIQAENFPQYEYWDIYAECCDPVRFGQVVAD